MRVGTYSCLALLLLAGVLMLASKRHHESTETTRPLADTAPASVIANRVGDAADEPPITLFYAPNGPTNDIGLNDPVFWATNHTDSILSLTLQRIEVKTRGAWITYATPNAGVAQLYFVGTSTRLGNLQPHRAGYASILPQMRAGISVPTNEVWRAEVSAAEMLTGFENLEAGVRSVPTTLKLRSHFGATNIPINPLSSEITRWGHHRVVYSEQMSQNETPEPRSHCGF